LVITEMAGTRKYEMRERAQQVARTRARIAAVAAELHEEVGPARTTVAEIARRAGVERLTVYKHYPDELALFGACQAHFLAEAPPPDPGAHAAISDPDVRLETVLRELYGWYREHQRMVRNVTRDAEVLPPLRETLAPQRRAMDGAVQVLLRGRGVRGRRRELVAAALGLVLSFRAWDGLTTAGLDDAEAARLAAAMVAGAVG
jgi:AcrR family transcriptional regulator